jgi:hypothetical protein
VWWTSFSSNAHISWLIELFIPEVNRIFSDQYNDVVLKLNYTDPTRWSMSPCSAFRSWQSESSLTVKRVLVDHSWRSNVSNTRTSTILHPQRKELDETSRLIVIMAFAQNVHLLRVRSLPHSSNFHSSHSLEIFPELGRT